MGCVSSTMGDEPDFSQIGGSSSSSAFAHHIVKLTSTTYGLLTLDPPPVPPPSDHTTTIVPPSPPPRFTLTSDLRPPPVKPDHDIIDSCELMAGLDSSTPIITKENSNPNLPLPLPPTRFVTTQSRDAVLRNCSSSSTSFPSSSLLDEFEKLCPPNGGESKVVIYTTTLRGIRKTFEACNAVRSALEGHGVLICERDISMDRGFRDELRQLMLMAVKGRSGNSFSATPSSPPMTFPPPRVFIKGRYIGGVEEVMRLAEDGNLGILLSALPKLRPDGGLNNLCEGCGGARFLPCFQCNGSCKIVTPAPEDDTNLTHGASPERTVVVRCSNCNENGLVLCPICCT